jgi:hypothetical protein
LKIGFSKPTSWDGRNIPGKDICTPDGGSPSTPGLYVRRIPPETNVIIVEFNDASDLNLSVDGGLGKIGYYHNGAPEVHLLPVPAETNKLPKYAFKEKGHRSIYKKGTAYMPPCGRNDHLYIAEVKAAKRTGEGSEKTTQILSYGYIKLGRY